MFENLHVWAIEVDQNRQKYNIGAQRGFIRDFGRSLYRSVDDLSSPLHSLQYVYFTRIFSQKYEMGAFVRLNFFVEDEDVALASVEDELDSRLKEWKNEGKVFDIKKGTKDGVEEEADDKGAKDFPELYYRYMHHISRMTVELFNRTGIEVDIDKILWTWTHNLFNLLRGFQVSVVEFDEDTIVRQLKVRRI